MKLNTLIVILSLAIIVGSCRKKDTTPDTSDVQVVITSPEEGHIYHTGDSVHVVAAISFNGILHGYEANVTDTATGNVIFDADEHVHKDTYVVNQSFLVTGSAPLVLKLRLLTEVDHNGSIVEKQVYFRYQP